MKQKLYDKIRGVYVEVITRAMVNNFGDCGFKTEWNLFSGGYITTWAKSISMKKKKEIKQYVKGFSDGYVEAMNQTLKVK